MPAAVLVGVSDPMLRTWRLCARRARVSDYDAAALFAHVVEPASRVATEVGYATSVPHFASTV
jgi:hypothetical protein